MSFIRKLLGLSEPEHETALPQIPTSKWAGYLASLIASTIERSGLADLPEMAAFVSRTDNSVGLCGGRDDKLPDMTDDPDVLVFCYIKDSPGFRRNADTIGKLLELNAKSAEMLAKGTGEDINILLRQQDDDILQSPMIDQMAFSVACELERRLAEGQSH
jgi:hypothetical protein